MEHSTIAYVVLGVFLFALLSWRTPQQNTTFGSAEWLRAWVASRKKLFRRGGLVVGDWVGLSPVYYRGSGHVLTVAPTGSGKGTAAIIPNLLQHPWIFLIDPGGENTAVAIRAWRDKRYTVHCLNPWDMHGGAPWCLPADSLNPLSILDPARATFASDADLLADMIVIRTGGENGSSTFFKDEARSGIRAFLMHIATAEPPERRNLITLRKYLTLEPSDWEQLIAAMKANSAAGGLIAREANNHERREAQSPEEFSGILSTMKQDTNFIEDPVMQRALTVSTVDLAELKGFSGSKKLPGCVVSVIIPLQYLDTHAAYARLIVGCALWAMQTGASSRERVLFVLDEFPALKRMDRIAVGLATLRKYNVWFWPVIQNLGQLKQLYGQNWQTFMSNAGLKQFIGAGDLESAQYISELCGDGTIMVKGQNKTLNPMGRRLATRDEVMHLRDREQLVFIDNLLPMVLRKTNYWERPFLRGKFHPNPYRMAMSDLDFRTPFWAMQGAILRACAWLAGPSPHAIGAALFALVHSANLAVSLGQSEDTANSRLVCPYLMTSGIQEFELRDPRPDESCHWYFFPKAD